MPSGQCTVAGEPEQAQSAAPGIAAGSGLVHRNGDQNDACTAATAALAAGEVDAELAKILGEEVWLTEGEAAMVQRFMPHQTDTIGFFVAAFVKKTLHV
jgi:hypothetical protein